MRDLRYLPKANLHLHLTGAMRPATLAELATRYGVAVTPAALTGSGHDGCGWLELAEVKERLLAGVRDWLATPGQG